MNHRRFSPLFFVLASVPVLAMAGAPPPLDDAGLRAAMARLPVVELRASTAGLPDTERRSLLPLVRAAEVLEALALRQGWGGNGEVLLRLLRDPSPAAPLRREAFLDARGAWWDVAASAPLARGLPSPPEAGTLYPPDATKAEIEHWLGALPAAERTIASGFYTVVRRTPDGQLKAVPYSTEYQHELARAADLLREAAALTAEPTLRALLDAEALAYRTNDYRAAEAAQVALQGRIYVALGPYDTDLDGWFGAKAGFISMVGLVDTEATKRLRTVSAQLQELQTRLPADAEVRRRRIARSPPLQVVDLLYASPVVMGLSLPNDPAVIAENGMRTAVFANTIRARHALTFAPLVRQVFAPGQPTFAADDAVLEVGLVRLMDGLGPATVANSGIPVAEALGAGGAPMLQAQSMILSLWVHEDLITRGVLPPAGRSAIYPAFVAVALRFLLSGPTSAAGRAYAWILGGMLDAGAVRIGPSGLAVDAAQCRAFVEARLREVLARTAAGDVGWAKAQLATVGRPRPEVESLLKRAAGIPLRARYVFPDSLSLAAP